MCKFSIAVIYKIKDSIISGFTCLSVEHRSLKKIHHCRFMVQLKYNNKHLLG